jgi:hypothetical protein
MAERINSAWTAWKFPNAKEYPLVVTQEKVEIPYTEQPSPSKPKTRKRRIRKEK